MKTLYLPVIIVWEVNTYCKHAIRQMMTEILAMTQRITWINNPFKYRNISNEMFVLRFSNKFVNAGKKMSSILPKTSPLQYIE